MNKNEIIEKAKNIKSDLVSRPNARNGKYRVCYLDQLYPENVLSIKNNDVFFLESLQVRANSADRIIFEAEEQGLNTNDPNVMKELGEKINALGELVHRSHAIMTAIFVSFRIIAYYAIAIGIWSLVFNKSFFSFLLYGSIAGFTISLLFVAPVISTQRTRERIRDIVFGAGLLVGNIGIIIGLIGLVAWIIRLIFFEWKKFILWTKNAHNPQIKATALKMAAYYKLLALVVKENCSLNVANKTN